MINEMDNITRERGYLTVPLYERSFGTEVSGDFTLPDYQNEIRRILHVSTSVLPPAKYIGDSSVEFNGTVDYQVLYIGGDGGMYSAPLSSDYSFSVPLEKGTNADMISDIFVLCSIGCESVNTRVSAPRRLSIRSRIRPNVRIYGKVPSITGALSNIDTDTVYIRKCECESFEGENASSDIIIVSSAIPTSNDDLRVVNADAVVRVKDIDKNENTVKCTGTVLFSLLCIREESGEFAFLEGEEAFEGDIDMQMSVSDAELYIKGVVSELNVNVADMGIECSIGIILEGTACKNSTVAYTADVYSSDLECDCSSRRMSVRNALTCFASNFTFSERIPLTNVQIPEGAEFICGFANVNADKCTYVSGKYVITGNAVITAVYQNDGDIYSVDVTSPIKYECDGARSECVCFDVCIRAENIKLRISDGNLCIDAEMTVCGDCLGESIAENVDKITFGEAIESDDSRLIVCYPSNDDTLWSVAKRYRVAPSAVLGNPATDKYVLIE